MRIPAIALVLSEFYEQEKEKAYNEGMPNIRTQWVLGPVWAKTIEQLKKDVINGVNPISGQPVMQEIVAKLTEPLSEEDSKTGEIKRTKGDLTFTDTEENLHQMFLIQNLQLDNLDYLYLQWLLTMFLQRYWIEESNLLLPHRPLENQNNHVEQHIHDYYLHKKGLM